MQMELQAASLVFSANIVVHQAGQVLTVNIPEPAGCSVLLCRSC